MAGFLARKSFFQVKLSCQINQCVYTLANDCFTFLSVCSVAKQIAPSDADQDLDLSTRLFVMYGTGPTGSGAQSLLPHNLGNADDASANPLRSQGRFNAAADAGGDVPFPTVNLLRAHGILMLISWPLLAVSGIFFAAWMRPAMPNGEWFKVCVEL